MRWQGGVQQTFVTIHSVPEWETKEAVQPEKTQWDFLPNQLDETVSSPQKTLNNLNLAVTGVEQAPSEEILKQLELGYQQAKRESAFEMQNGAYVFQTGLSYSNGNPVIASLKPTTFGNFHWYLNFAGVSQNTVSISPGRALERFAFLGSWQSFLEQLAAKALPEPWDFKESTQKSNFILKKYIQYTFHRLMLEDKISISQVRLFCGI